MKSYITFGQVHIHRVNNKTFDKDCVAVINCKDREDGRNKAFEFFGDKFFTDYTEEDIQDKMHFYSRGMIEVE